MWKPFGRTHGFFGSAFLTAICLQPAVSQADIYKYVDKYGHVHLTDRPDHKGYKLLVRTTKGWKPTSIANYQNRRTTFTPTISKAAQTYRLPDALLHAVITAESAYNPEAISPAGAVGLMQLMPETAARYGVSDRRDPVANVNGGTRYLRDLLQMFSNNVILALAAYNAGENAVIKYGNKIPPYEETQLYVRKVLEYYKRYRSATIALTER